jgi:Zn-finger nucleic acid-binding protein
MILACPGCGGRYDVTGHAVGQKFRCQCGVILTFASAPPDDAEHAAAAIHRPCPRCDALLHARRVGDVVIDECAGCAGVFLDHVAIQRITVEREPSRAVALLGALARAELRPLPAAGQRMYVPCPVCAAVMNRRLFASGTGIIIDICHAHGAFFDAGELPRIIDFVMHGGLETAQRQDIERRRSAARHELEQAHAVELPGARLLRSPAGHGGALVEFLVSLFH